MSSGPKETARCDHKHIAVMSTNTMGYASCMDCNEEIPLDLALNSVFQRLQSAIETAEKLNEERAHAGQENAGEER